MTGRWLLYLNSPASGIENAVKTEMILLPRGSVWIDLDSVFRRLVCPMHLKAQGVRRISWFFPSVRLCALLCTRRWNYKSAPLP